MSEEILLHKDQDQFIKNLRQGTAESHLKLEENPLSKAILDPAVTVSDYQKYLIALYGVTASCERQVFPLLSTIVPDLDQRFKADLIVDDLRKTGLPEELINSIPVYQFEFSTIPEALGIMYVLEGSTLGGRVLYKHINQTLGLTYEEGASYFWGYGPQTGVLWKSFIAALTRFVEESDDAAPIIESAKKTFTLIDNWLSSK